MDVRKHLPKAVWAVERAWEILTSFKTIIPTEVYSVVIDHCEAVSRNIVPESKQ